MLLTGGWIVTITEKLLGLSDALTVVQCLVLYIHVKHSIDPQE